MNIKNSLGLSFGILENGSIKSIEVGPIRISLKAATPFSKSGTNIWLRKRKNGKQAPAVRQQQASADPTSIGNLLITFGAINEDTLSRALEFQRDNPDVLLGETLMKLGILKVDDLENAVAHQKMLRAEGADKQKLLMRHLSTAADKLTSLGNAFDDLSSGIAKARQSSTYLKVRK